MSTPTNNDNTAAEEQELLKIPPVNEEPGNEAAEPSKEEEAVDKEAEDSKEQEEATSEEDKESEEEEDDLFAPWRDLRSKMIEDGIPMEEMDARFEENSLTDEDYAIIAEKSGNPVSAVKTHIKLLAKEREKQLESVKQAEANFYSQMDESAGGSYTDLLGWVAANANPDQKELWQDQLNRKDPQVTLRVIRAMQATREIVEGPSKSNAEKVASESNRASLDLLTASNSTPAKAQAQVLAKQAEQLQKATAEVDPLEGNPYKDYSYYALCQERMKLTVDKRGQVDEVLRVRHNL